MYNLVLKGVIELYRGLNASLTLDKVNNKKNIIIINCK